jgi:hypothetical protein
MDLKQIEYFVRVAELGGFTRAAAALGVAQPALSRQVRLLEVELRQNLLARDGRGAVPTEAELTVSTFEKLGGIASMSTLPELLHLHKATTYKPEADDAQANRDSSQADTTTRVNAVKRPSPSRHVQLNALKRAASAQQQLQYCQCSYITFCRTV